MQSDLRLYYDTHNPKCFTPSGTVITDLSGNGYNATFKNPVYGNDGFQSNQPYYDGNIPPAGNKSLGSYTQFSSIQTTDRLGGGNTILFWVYKETNTDMGGLWYSSLYKQVELRTSFLYCEGNTNSRYFHSPTHTVGSSWMMYAFTYKDTGVEWFRNGVSIGVSPTTLPAWTENDVSFLYIGPAPYVSSLQGFWPVLMWYDKVLTAKEVLQNYNALKSRFGK